MSKTSKYTRYAVVDLEATGTGRYANIIQVGIVLIEGGRIQSTYTTDVNPHEPLDDHIQHLTGLTDERLATAPTFSQVAAEIYDLIKDAVFVAHNVRFDANLLAEQLFMEGYELRTPRVDTVELAQVFFPRLEKYSLSTISQALSLDLEQAHTALADAHATAQLFLKIQEKIRSLPRLLVERLLFLADSLLYESGTVIDALLEETSLQLPKTHLEVSGLVVKLPVAKGKPKLLSSDFETNMSLLDLEARSGQLEFATALSHFLANDQVGFLQAPTGLGKTYAYLLTSLAQASGRQVVVSVPTLVLQEQVMSQEVERLRQVFQVKALSVKSPRHYIDLERFDESLAVKDSNRLVNRLKMQLLVWLYETETGDLDEIRQKQGQEAFFETIRHDGQLLKSSRFYDVDFLERRRQLEQTSQLLVTNHAYLLTRNRDDKTFLENKLLIVDEAQRFFLNLEDFSRAKLDLEEQLQLLTDVMARPFSVLYHRLLERLQFECQSLLEKSRHVSHLTLTTEQVEMIRQDLSECHVIELLALKQVFAPQFTQFWLTRVREGESQKTYLHGASLDLLQANQLLPQSTQVAYVSATLAISPEVSLADLLGYSEITSYQVADQIIMNQAVWLDQSMPLLSEVSEAVFLAEVVARLTKLSHLRQPTLVLFTSRKAMFDVSEELEELGVTHLCQDRHGPANHLKNRFEKEKGQILLGTGSFWEGVDFAKHPNMLQVIVRLPFDNPRDYLVQKINTELSLRGHNPFKAYSLPIVTLRLKQAMGRSNRSSQQLSAVLILDSRIVHKTYGETIRATLSKQWQVRTSDFEHCFDEIADFLQIEKES